MRVADPTATISSVTGLIHEIQKSGLASTYGAHVKLWFRGQPKKDLSLKPRVYRDRFGEKKENERLNIERGLAHDFLILSSSIRRGSESDEELYFLQQHYRMPTRLLDWTTNPMAALFFAVAAVGPKGGPEPDGELFMMDVWEFRLDAGKSPREAYGRKFRGIAHAWHPVFKREVHKISQWTDDQFPGFILPVRPHNFDVRINLQRSCFTFHVPDQQEITPDINPSLRSFYVPGSKKQEIRKELNVLGIDPFRVFGDLEHLTETLCEAHDVA
jgi:hypothetical protein